MIHTYRYNDTTYTVRLERQPDGGYMATVSHEDANGAPVTRSYALTATALRGGWLLGLEDGRRSVYTAAQDNARFVHVNGERYTLSVPDARARRGAAASGGDLTAKMPGQVIEVPVTEGDPVTDGQTLVVLEAMKMEIRVAAPADGTIKRLLVERGDMVERGQTLVEFEPE